VEPAVEDVVLAGLHGGRAPHSTHRVEADVVGVSVTSLERTRSAISPAGPALRSFAQSLLHACTPRPQPMGLEKKQQEILNTGTGTIPVRGQRARAFRSPACITRGHVL
jgi:hypothetical protein